MSHKLKQIKSSGRKVARGRNKKHCIVIFCVELVGFVVVLYVFEDQSIGRWLRFGTSYESGIKIKEA